MTYILKRKRLPQTLGETFILIPIIFVLLLRWHNLTTYDLWYDEIFTVKNALLHNPSEEWFLYHLLIYFLGKVFGYSSFTLRFPSFVFSTLSILTTYKIAKYLFDRKVAIFASILMGLSPFQLWYAQEARVYALSIFLTTISFLYFYKLIKGDNCLIKFLLINAVGTISCHTFFYIFLICEIIIFIFLRKKYFLYTLLLIVSVFIVLKSSSLFTTLIKRVIFYSRGHAWIPQPVFPKSIIYTLDDMFLGYSGSQLLYGLLHIVLGIIFVCFVHQIFLRQHNYTKNLLIVSFFGIFPCIFAFIFSKAFFPIYVHRYFIIFSPYIYISTAAILLNISNKYIRTTVSATLLCLIIISIQRYFANILYDKPPYGTNHATGVHLKKPVQPLVNFVLKNIHEGDVICFTHPRPMLPFEFYYNLKTHRDLSSHPSNMYYLFSPEVLYSPTRQKLKENKFFKDVNRIRNFTATNNVKRIFFIGCDWGRSGALDANSKKVKLKLDKLYHKAVYKKFDGIILIIYNVKQNV